MARSLTYTWRAGDGEHELRFVPVPGTGGKPFLFGAGAQRRPIEVRDFHMQSTPVTQALWVLLRSSPGLRSKACQQPGRPIAVTHVDLPDVVQSLPAQCDGAIAGAQKTWSARHAATRGSQEGATFAQGDERALVEEVVCVLGVA